MNIQSLYLELYPFNKCLKREYSNTQKAHTSFVLCYVSYVKGI